MRNKKDVESTILLYFICHYSSNSHIIVGWSVYLLVLTGGTFLNDNSRSENKLSQFSRREFRKLAHTITKCNEFSRRAVGETHTEDLHLA